MKVRIKTWEEMEKEFGVEFDTIKTYAPYTDMMEGQIPENRIISVSDGDSTGCSNWHVDGNNWDWTISDDMIAEIIEE
jgi:hypothetical protein